MRVFFSPDDYRSYAALLARQAERHQLRIWAYCLMPNHVHLVAVPATEKGLARPIGEAHRLYSVMVNQRQGWTGHLWQERFSSFPMDESHLLAAVRYVLRNPIRAGLAETAAEWPHSSARALVLGRPDKLIECGPIAERSSQWKELLEESDPPGSMEALRRHTRVGRPLGDGRFIDRLERTTGRRLRPQRPGRRPMRK